MLILLLLIGGVTISNSIHRIINLKNKDIGRLMCFGVTLRELRFSIVRYLVKGILLVSALAWIPAKCFDAVCVNDTTVRHCSNSSYQKNKESVCGRYDREQPILKEMEKDMEQLIHTHKLTKVYGKKEAEVVALNEVTLDLYRDECVAVVGTSGSGKTTLLNLIGGMARPESGEIIYYNKNGNQTNICKVSDRELAAYRKDSVGFVFQNFELVPELTAKENILLPLTINHLKADMDFFAHITEQLKLETRLTHYPDELSGGQKQRVAIARAIINSPELLLCDEPTGNLDERTGQEVLELLLMLREELSQTMVIVTHDRKVAGNCNRKIEILDGKII